MEANKQIEFLSFLNASYQHHTGVTKTLAAGSYRQAMDHFERTTVFCTTYVINNITTFPAIYRQGWALYHWLPQATIITAGNDKILVLQSRTNEILHVSYHN